MSETDGFYAFVRDRCCTEHFGQDEIAACEAAKLNAWRELTEAERQVYLADVTAEPVRVQFCNWCPDPPNPSAAAHPDGGPIHRPVMTASEAADFEAATIAVLWAAISPSAGRPNLDAHR